MPRLDGPDIAHYQYYPDPALNPRWSACRASGCWWGATKMTQSTRYADPTGPASRAGMHEAGFTHIGLYHWLSSTTPVATQVSWYLHNIGRLTKGEFAMLDAEEAGITAAMVQLWCDLVEAVTGRVVVVYTGAYTAGGTVWRSIGVRQSKLGQRPRILAAYISEARAKALPGIDQFPWQGWQFSSNGPVPGITGRCDMNRIDDKEAFNRACGLTVSDNPRPPVIEHPPAVVPLEPPTVVVSWAPEGEDDTMQAKLLQSESHGTALQLFFADGYTMTGLAGQSIESVKAGYQTGDPIRIDDVAYDDLASKAKRA